MLELVFSGVELDREIAASRLARWKNLRLSCISADLGTIAPLEAGRARAEWAANRLKTASMQIQQGIEPLFFTAVKRTLCGYRC